MSNDIVANRSALKDFLTSIATISGDLSNITAPPFVLSEKSTVEIPQYWADHQSLFVSQSKEEAPEKRALSVLRYFLCTLRNQQYAGRPEADGVKKPLNAFLGELFMGSWHDNEEIGETRLISEQVSHHPPVTACYLWNDKHGVRAEGFTQQEVTFNGNVSIKQKGYAILHIDKYEEDHLIPVPNIKVKGILSGVPYPELNTECSIVSSSGYTSHIKFSGKSMFGYGSKHHFEARLFHNDSPKKALFTAEGVWNGNFAIKDETGKILEEVDVNSLPSTEITVEDLEEQDPWESRRAWQNVVKAERSGDMKGVARAKSKVEEGQRQMRKEEEARGETWNNIFFTKVESDPVFEELSKHDPSSYTVDPHGGIWKANREAVTNIEKPFHGDITPANKRTGDISEASSRKSSQASVRSSGSVQAEPFALPHRPVEDDDSGIDVQSTTSEEPPKVEQEQKLASREPTDAQVAEFLRAKHSNVAH